MTLRMECDTGPTTIRQPSPQGGEEIFDVVLGRQARHVWPLDAIFVRGGQKLGMVRVPRPPPVFRGCESLDDQIASLERH